MTHRLVALLVKCGFPTDIARLIVFTFGGGIHPCALVIKESNSKKFIVDMLFGGGCEIGGPACNPVDYARWVKATRRRISRRQKARIEQMNQICIDRR